MSLTPEQLEMRKTGIGASETPMLVGESPHGNAIDVYLRKLGLAQEVHTDAQELGNLLEDGIVRWYEKKVGATCSPATTLRHPRAPISLATPDRFVNGRQKLLQIKLVGTWMAWHWDGDRPPPYVLVQVQKEMEVADVELCDVAALIGGTDPRIYQVVRDREMGEALLEIDADFWTTHIAPKIPPPVDGSRSATEMLKRIHPRHGERKLELTPDLSALVEELRTSARDESSAAKRYMLAEQRIKTMMADAQSVRGDDWTITWRTNAIGARVFRFTDKRKAD